MQAGVPLWVFFVYDRIPYNPLLPFLILTQLLERREQQMDSRTQKPLIVELYEEMRKYMDKAFELMPTFMKMVDSLR